MDSQNIQIITAIENDGRKVRTLTIACKILQPTKKLDLLNAIRKSTQHYLHSKEGRQVYEYNNQCFNYGDFVANVPNEINRLFGFETIDSTLGDLTVNFDEHLVDDEEYDEYWMHKPHNE